VTALHLVNLDAQAVLELLSPVTFPLRTLNEDKAAVLDSHHALVARGRGNLVKPRQCPVENIGPIHIH
jgi:hypothetical protein